MSTFPAVSSFAQSLSARLARQELPLLLENPRSRSHMDSETQLDPRSQRHKACPPMDEPGLLS